MATGQGLLRFNHKLGNLRSRTSLWTTQFSVAPFGSSDDLKNGIKEEITLVRLPYNIVIVPCLTLRQLKE